MKIKDLAAMAGSCRNMQLISTRDMHGNIIRQHLSLNGKAVFPLDGMQAITPDTLLTIADVEEEIREKYTVTESDITRSVAELVDDLRETDLPAKIGKINLKTRYSELIAIHADSGKETHFLPAAMLKPIKDARQLNFVIRRTADEQAVIVALDGMAHIASFAPYIGWADEESVDEMRKMNAKVRMLADEEAIRRQEEEDRAR